MIHFRFPIHFVVGILLLISSLKIGFSAPGPGLPTAAAPADKVLKVLFQIPGSVLSGNHTGLSFFDGWMVALADGGLSFVNVSDIDNMKVETTYALTMPEPYNLAASPSLEGGKWGFIANAKGVVALNLADIKNPVKTEIPVQIAGVSLSGKEYTNRIEQFAIQLPYLFVPMSTEGLAVLDVSDMSAPKVLKHLTVDDVGISNLGYAWAVGNIMAITAHNKPGYAVLDISDPANPKVLTAKTDNLLAYGSTMNGNAIYANPKSNHGVQKIDISNPASPVVEAAILGGKAEGGGYLMIQDGFMHVGCSGYGYAKINLTSKEKVAELVKADLAGHKDLDYAAAFGQIAALGDDDNKLTSIFLHQAEPDKVAPKVNMVSPKDKAVQQALTSRIGITLTDQVDFRTVSGETFVVRKAGTPTPIAGKFSVIRSIVNFSPDSPLAVNTVYEVVIPAGGIKDVAGNGVAEQFISQFSTGATLSLGNELWTAAANVKLKPTMVFLDALRDARLNQSISLQDIFGRKINRNVPGSMTKGVFILSEEWR